MNFFKPKSAAERYAKGRPYFHPRIIQRVKEYLSLAEPLSRALDIGCGAGLSTCALRGIAEKVVGVDVSTGIVALAPKLAGVEYLVAPAENLPFCDGEFGMVTASQVFHWLDRGKFLKEARRVLWAGGWLIVYDNYFSGHENAEFRVWYQKSYLKRYPNPPRVWACFEVEDTEKEGFHLLYHERYENAISFSLEGLIDYLMSQSNIIAAFEGGRESIDETRAWLKQTVEPLFGKKKETEILFSAPIWYLQRAT